MGVPLPSINYSLAGSPRPPALARGGDERSEAGGSLYAIFELPQSPGFAGDSPLINAGAKAAAPLT